MAWQACKWERAYGKVLLGEVVEVRPRQGESTVYGPRYRWSVLHVRAQLDLADGFADSVDAASAAADAWVAALAQAAADGEVTRGR